MRQNIFFSFPLDYHKHMKDVRIKVIKKSFYKELSALYEKEMGDCLVEERDECISKDALMPERFYQSAWSNLYPYVFSLSSGGGSFFGEWMKNPHSAVISCNDGIRPVSFLLETIE